MRISEVSEQCDIAADTLSYYERIGLLPPVNRSDSGIRDYSGLDVRRVEFIKCMRTAGLQKTLDLLDYKISFYENALGEKEHELIELVGGRYPVGSDYEKRAGK
jgi:hypothetical protein